VDKTEMSLVYDRQYFVGMYEKRALIERPYRTGVRVSREPITRSGSLTLAHSGLISSHASGVENRSPCIYA
jgi:hypothetical protein